MKKLLLRVIPVGGLLMLLLSWSVAYAGGVIPHEDSVIFENGQSTVGPGAMVRMRFRVTQYTYGSPEYAYVSLGIAPRQARTSKVSAVTASRWPILGVLASKPLRSNTDSDEYDAPIYRVAFRAPQVPGRYKLLLGGVPMFTASRLPYEASMRQSFVPTEKDKPAFVSALTKYDGRIKHVAEFTVSPTAPTSDETLTLYLRLNGEVPVYAKNIGGMQNNPVTFSWKIGPELKRTGGKLQYRYRLQPNDEEFGVWTDATQVSYSFLLRGIHEFQVQARFVDGNTIIESQPASYQFNVPKEHIAKPQSKAPFSMDVKVPPVSYDNVYKKSRALLVGMWEFSDTQHFPTFDQGKITADMESMRKALSKNGFEVSVLAKNQITRDEIVKALASLVASARRNDRIFVYFSTHGFADPNSPSEGYLATSDCSYDTPEVRCLKLRDLEHYAGKALNSQEAKQVLFAVDSCFSGLGIVRKSSATTQHVNFSQLAVPKGAFMLTAGMATQTAQIDPQLGMSTFAHFLAKGLDGEGDLMKNGLMTLSQLYVYVQWKVAQQTGSAQIPMMGKITGDGEMLFWPRHN